MSCLSKSHHLTYRHLNKKLIFYMNFLNLKLLQFKNRSKNLNQTKLSKRNKIRQVKYSQPLEKKYVRQDLSGSVKQKLYNVCYRQLKPMKMKKQILNKNHISRVNRLKGFQLINVPLFLMLRLTLTTLLLLSTAILQSKKQK